VRRELIKSAISVLKELYPECRIYTEAVRSGLKVPCFFVMVGDINDELYRGKMRRADITLDISYYPCDAESMQSECGDVADAVYSAFEYLTTAFGVLRSVKRDISYENSGRHKRENRSSELLDEEYMSISVGYELYYLSEGEADTDIGIMEELSEEVTANG
jgi:hypothetical protein